jgi:hypothetical protein
MNLLREYIKEILSESKIHPKIMSMIDRADAANYHVVVKATRVQIFDGSKNEIAIVSWKRPEEDYDGPCLDAAVIVRTEASEGLGPLAYDIAIEATGGLTSDRMLVSDDAENVWDYYTKKRPDVEIEQLDSLGPEGTLGLSHLTPERADDDCMQVPAYYSKKDKWYDSSLSKKVGKVGTPVMDELRKRGMLYE